MKIEYEATFVNIDKNKVRSMLKEAKAKLLKPEFIQKRTVFHFPSGHEVAEGWIRVRDEGDKITMSIKVIDGEKIEDQKEICVKVDNFNEAVLLLTTLGCVQKSYQETKRELWQLDGVEITIDEWPFLEPFVEVEGSSEIEVKAVSEKLGFKWGEAKFCDVSNLYSEKYTVTKDVINNHTPKIVFEMNNPFIK